MPRKFASVPLTSDKMGAIFGAEVFDPESDKSLGEQLLAFLESLGASEPESAPNYASMPESDSRNSPSARNFSTEPMYSNNDKDASK